MVGDYTDSAGFTHGYSSVGGSLSTIDFPGADLTLAFGINNSGVIVGMYVDINNKEHGFRYSNGTIAPITFPGGSFFAANSINDSGDIVGRCVDSSGHVYASKFTAATGQAAPLTSPGVTVSDATGINNAGQIVGTYSGGQFLFSGGSFTTLNCPLTGCGWTILSIDNVGKIAGVYTVSQLEHGLLASTVELLDPVPELLDGPAVSTFPPLLATKGRSVAGVAADGVTQVVLRIPANSDGDQVLVTLLNDQQFPVQSSSADEDGALGNPGDANFSQSQITVTAQDTGKGVFAFAVYRAPVDFARPAGSGSFKSGSCRGASATDDQLACRAVSLEIQNQASGTNVTVPALILRPPVVMIHGLWSDWSTWSTFAPLVTGPNSVDSRFSIGRVDYSAVVGAAITASDPAYPRQQLDRAQANSLGFQYNALFVLTQIELWIINLKEGSNPEGVPVAAVQADIVAHSMGGDITRTLPLQTGFPSYLTFGQGPIHKTITIDTPHLGSPLAIRLLEPEENGRCLQKEFAAKGMFALNTVAFPGTPVVSGAMADLQGDGNGGSLSPALQNVANAGPRPLPTALIAGVYTNFANLDDTFGWAHVVRFVCSDDPLAQSLTAAGWQQLFANLHNDAVVSEVSELNNLAPAPDPGNEFVGYVHSQAFENLGFTGPSVLDPGAVPNQVLLLLNTPVTSSTYYHLLNP